MVVEKLEHSRTKLTFDVTPEEFEKALDKAFEEENAKVSIQGFRKGKAPRSVFEKHYGVESLYATAIDVILNKCMIMIYAKDGDKGYTIPVKAMTCSPGLPGHDTITGTYKIRKVGTWHTLFYNSYGQYATNIHGNFLFHSVGYTKYGDHYSLSKKAYSQLGQKASHGCIRLLVKDAKWIYDHVGNIDKTTLRKGSKNTKTPLAKPTTKKIGKTSDGRYYDPTDPNIKQQA
jgi:hypothetical protein